MRSGSIIPFLSEFLPYTRLKRDSIHRAPESIYLNLTHALTIQATTAGWLNCFFYFQQEHEELEQIRKTKRAISENTGLRHEDIRLNGQHEQDEEVLLRRRRRMSSECSSSEGQDIEPPIVPVLRTTTSHSQSQTQANVAAGNNHHFVKSEQQQQQQQLKQQAAQVIMA